MTPLSRLSYIHRSIFNRIKGYPKKKVLVLEGGGMRGIFLTGLLQAFTDRGYCPWQLIVGSSAGALTGTAYAAGQIHLARDAFFNELLTGQFIRMSNIFRPEKHILNLDWMVETIIKGDEPLNLKKLRRTACPVFITATRVNEDRSPETIYLNTKHDNIPVALKATAAIPFLYRGFVEYSDSLLLDGALLDPIPYLKALSLGYKEKDILIVLTRKKGYRKRKESFWINALYESYYKDEHHRFFLEALNDRFKQYNYLLDDIETNHPDIDVIYPPADFKVNRLTRNEEKILKGFEQGVAAAKEYLYYHENID